MLPCVTLCPLIPKTVKNPAIKGLIDFLITFLHFFSSDVYNILEKRNFDKFDNLLKQKPDIINSMRDKYGRTLLMLAAFVGNIHIVALLSKRNHDLSVVNDDHSGLNALHFIINGNKTNDDVSLELLESLDVSQLSSDVVNKQDESNFTPLHRAAEFNMHKTIVWLLRHGANPSIKNKHLDLPGKHYHCDRKTKKLIKDFRKYQSE